MKNFQFPMDQDQREMVAKYIERYRLIEERGQFSFTLSGTLIRIRNFAIPGGALVTTLRYFTMREKIQYVLTRLSESLQDNDREKFAEWFDKMIDPYAQFMYFCIEEGYETTFFTSMGNQMKVLDGKDYLDLMMDTIGMIDHAVTYDAWLLKQVSDMLEMKDVEAIRMWSHRFPSSIEVKVVDSREEGEAWIREMEAKHAAKDEASGSPEIDLNNMTPMGNA